jgi:hypothetical protein
VLYSQSTARNMDNFKLYWLFFIVKDVSSYRHLSICVQTFVTYLTETQYSVSCFVFG